MEGGTVPLSSFLMFRSNPKELQNVSCIERRSEKPTKLYIKYPKWREVPYIHYHIFPTNSRRE